MTKMFVVNADESISVSEREPEAPQRDSRTSETKLRTKLFVVKPDKSISVSDPASLKRLLGGS